jgi:hypothetical protein
MKLLLYTYVTLPACPSKPNTLLSTPSFQSPSIYVLYLPWDKHFAHTYNKTNTKIPPNIWFVSLSIWRGKAGYSEPNDSYAIINFILGTGIMTPCSLIWSTVSGRGTVKAEAVFSCKSFIPDYTASLFWILQYEFQIAPALYFRKCTHVLNFSSESELLYDWRFTANHFVMATGPLRPTTSKFSFQLNTCGYNSYVTSSLTRGLVSRLELLLSFSHSQVRVRRGSWPHFTVSDLRLPATWRTRSLYLYPPGTGWPGYTPRQWVGLKHYEREREKWQSSGRHYI